ncbi:hypothetical protein [Ligilactobacillus acidipiscis]|uniref:hypothetical protein n=1 Tax=Ligilactobacillus acidipiscis TaxID=89059 RepID=UPI0023F984C5|nr:hypothetical protein [Ligilactobacillus acidipiscis]WEV56168.1 hypothetical protein OZX66_07885 [Ligilactobacillus acidipiscis]
MTVGPLENEGSFDYSKLPKEEAKELKKREIEIKRILWNFYKKTGMTLQEYEEKIEMLEREENERVK